MEGASANWERQAWAGMGRQAWQVGRQTDTGSCRASGCMPAASSYLSLSIGASPVSFNFVGCFLAWWFIVADTNPLNIYWQHASIESIPTITRATASSIFSTDTPSPFDDDDVVPNPIPTACHVRKHRSRQPSPTKREAPAPASDFRAPSMSRPKKEENTDEDYERRPWR